MKLFTNRFLFLLGILVLPASQLAQVPDKVVMQTNPENPAPTFSAVSSILDEHCVMCHNGPKAPKGLRLDSYERIRDGSTRGPILIPGKPSESEIVRRIHGLSTPRMPLSGPPWLDDEEIGLIEDWIRKGAAPDTTMVSRQSGIAFTPPDRLTYTDVEPIFRSNCLKCHSQKGLMGGPPEGFKVTMYSDVLMSSERAHIVPTIPDASELVRRIRGQALPRMPFDGPPYLTEEQIALVERWVAEGAADERGKRAQIPVGRSVRLHGRVSDRWALDGLWLEISGASEFKNRVSTGDYVEVRGRVTGSGTVRVERIKKRHGD